MQPRFQVYRRDGLAWWRLLGRNNRSLARSARGFADLDQARADAVRVSGQAGRAPVELVSDQGTAWRWVLAVGDVPRATSAMSYARRVECLRAVARFREAAAVAPVAEQPLVVRRLDRAASDGRATHPGGSD